MHFYTSAWKTVAAFSPRPVFAIGDVHGRWDLLQALHRHLEKTLLPAVVGHAMVVHLGDLIDRGPQSIQALQGALQFSPPGVEAHVLPGNHEQMMVYALWSGRDGQGTMSAKRYWCQFGGEQVLADVERHVEGELTWDKVRSYLTPCLQRLWHAPTAVSCGDWILVHAGVPEGWDPDAVLSYDWKPWPEDLQEHPLWVGGDFLKRNAPYPRHQMVLHGHIAGSAPVVRSWRVCVDTHAYASGMLTMAELSGHKVRFHSVIGPAMPELE